MREQENHFRGGRNLIMSLVLPQSPVYRHASQGGLIQALWEMRCDAGDGWREAAARWLSRVRHLPRLLRLAKKRRYLIEQGHVIAPLAYFPVNWRGGRGGMLKIGEETMIADSVELTLNADVTIGSRVVVSSDVKLLT